ncbi:hypothetical protein CALVIDRAFT_536188, partial [Calocera viscosa TUFC12733]
MGDRRPGCVGVSQWALLDAQRVGGALPEKECSGSGARLAPDLVKQSLSSLSDPCFVLRAPCRPAKCPLRAASPIPVAGVVL